MPLCNVNGLSTTTRRQQYSLIDGSGPLQPWENSNDKQKRIQGCVSFVMHIIGYMCAECYQYEIHLFLSMRYHNTFNLQNFVPHALPRCVTFSYNSSKSENILLHYLSDLKYDVTFITRDDVPVFIIFNSYLGQIFREKTDVWTPINPRPP